MIKINFLMKKLIQNNFCAFATSTKKGKSNVIAVGAVKVKNNSLILSNIFMNKSIKNLKENSFCSLAVWDSKTEKGFQLKGTAKTFSKGKYFDFVKHLPENKKMKVQSAIVFQIKEIYDLNSGEKIK